MVCSRFGGQLRGHPASRARGKRGGHSGQSGRDFGLRIAVARQLSHGDQKPLARCPVGNCCLDIQTEILAFARIPTTHVAPPLVLGFQWSHA